MKLLSIAIPCYNSADYMDKCIQSLLPGGDRVEIILVDDGSTKDATPEIADRYAAEYPDIIRAVHEENAGHGGAVNRGLAEATGAYFKVVDSDDWVDYDAYMKILDTLEDLLRHRQAVDMMVTDFVYDKEGAKHKKVMRYANAFPQNRVFTWSEMKSLHMGQYILMHSVIYRTMMLKRCGFRLPEHTFYVDNIFVYTPLPHVKRLYYMDISFYHYYIGREDQSVNEKVMISRVDQQLKVNRYMAEACDLEELRKKKPKVCRYMFSYLEIITTISSMMLIRSHEKANLKKKRELWDFLREKQPGTYWRMRFRPLGFLLNIPGWPIRKLSEIIYWISQQIYGFN